jgi:hypothetical protein
VNYAVVLLLLALSLFILGVFYGGILAALLFWSGANFFLVGVAHARKAHGIFGKRADGSLPWWSWVIFLPLHLLNTFVWHLFRALATEPASNPVSERLTVGRRLLPHENPGGFDNYIDLTAEFSEPRILRETRGYVAFPILDASAPSLEHLKAAVDRLRLGRTFIHCAQGHGRTGLFALAYLLSTGSARTVEEGMSLLTKARPAIRLNRAQMTCVQMFARRLSAGVDDSG